MKYDKQRNYRSAAKNASSAAARCLDEPRAHRTAGRIAGRAAFTLIEILIVIAISVLLFGLLLRPLFQSLAFTKDAQVESAAQDSARKTTEMITRELAAAAYVFDNASHPFNGAAPGTGADQSSNFLNIGIPNLSGATVPGAYLSNIPVSTFTKHAYTDMLLHIYGAKLDFVMPRRNDTTMIDPTTKEPIRLVAPTNGGSGATAEDPGTLFPVAPGTTMVRYFIGLQNPEKPYFNPREGVSASDREDANTYILYRAQFLPLHGLPANAGDPPTHQTLVNEDLFVPSGDPATWDTSTLPDYDDPDFFRVVNTGDVNWLSPTHAVYTAGEVAAHNLRVDHWRQIAKAVIDAPEIDLLVLPRTPDGTIDYDNSPAFSGIPHFGAATDPVTGIKYPIGRFSVSFGPAPQTSVALAATTSNYQSLGIVANDAAGQGFPYIPASFTANSASWTFPYSIKLTPPPPAPTPTYSYYTVVAPTAVSNPLNIPYNAGDLLEIRSATSVADQVVYNISLDIPGFKTTIASDNNYVPLQINPDSGLINFAIRAKPPSMDLSKPSHQNPPNPLPAGWGTSGSAYPAIADNINWYFGANDVNNAPSGSNPGVGNGKIDMTTLRDGSGTICSPLAPVSGAAPTGFQIANARLVPGSLQVYGPDAVAGRNLGRVIMYGEVPSSAVPGPNQYQIDYVNEVISFGPTALPVLDASGGNADPVQIAFDFQANMVLPNNANPISSTNAYQPFTVQVDYQSRDVLDINIGVRVYTPSSNRAHTINMDSKVKINNANR